MTLYEYNLAFAIMGIMWGYLMVAVVRWRYQENLEKLHRHARNLLIMRTFKHRRVNPQEVLGSRYF